MRDVVLAVVCRFLFVSHSLIAIVKSQRERQEAIYWVLLAPVGLQLLEAVVTIFTRGGKEYKWISPCVLLYLCGILPSIWLLELKNLNSRNLKHVCSSPYWGEDFPGCRNMYLNNKTMKIETDDDLHEVLVHDENRMDKVCSLLLPYWNNYTAEEAAITTMATMTTMGDPDSVLDLNKLDKETINSMVADSKEAIDSVLNFLEGNFDDTTWILVFHQSLLFILIIGRWLLPTGKGVSRDELSQLLLVFIGVGADILEFVVEMIKEESVRCDKILIIIIMALWSWSTLQFTMVLTASKARRPRAVGVYEDEMDFEEEESEDFEEEFPYELEDTKQQGKCMKFFTNVEVWGISTTLILQDGPFLAMRLYIMIARNVIHQMIVFFTIKNILVFFLQVYRLVVIATASTEEEEEAKAAKLELKKAEENLNTLKSVNLAKEKFKRSLQRQRTRSSMVSSRSSTIGRRRELPHARASTSRDSR